MIAEKQFEAQIKQLAKVMGWLYYHTYRSTRSVAGFPDVVMVRPPRVIFCELKREDKNPTPAQEEWLDLLDHCPGVEAYVWRPSDWDAIVEILR